MAPRLDFYLVFSKNPPSADVIREDSLLPLSADNAGGSSSEDFDTCFKFEVSKDKFEIIKGKILAKGLKKDMTARKVSSTGVLLSNSAETFVKDRKKELRQIKLAQSYANKVNLQSRAEDMLDDANDDMQEFITKHTAPVHRSTLPKKRTPELLEALRRKVAALPCFLPGQNKTELWTGMGVFVPTGPLSLVRLRYKKKPKRLVSALLHLTLPDSILLEDGFSVQGKRGCVGLSSRVLEAINLHTGAIYKKTGGDLQDTEVDPIQQLKNLITNTRRKYGMFVNETTQQTSTHTSTPTTPHTPPHDTAPHDTAPHTPPHDTAPHTPPPNTPTHTHTHTLLQTPTNTPPHTSTNTPLHTSIPNPPYTPTDHEYAFDFQIPRATFIELTPDFVVEQNVITLERM